MPVLTGRSRLMSRGSRGFPSAESFLRCQELSAAWSGSTEGDVGQAQLLQGRKLIARSRDF